MTLDAWLNGDEGQRVVEAAARAIWRSRSAIPQFDTLDRIQQDNYRYMARAALRAALTVTAKCETCYGTGAKPVSAWPDSHTCDVCGGSGSSPDGPVLVARSQLESAAATQMRVSGGPDSWNRGHPARTLFRVIPWEADE